jgi:hypothetical protein
MKSIKKKKSKKKIIIGILLIVCCISIFLIFNHKQGLKNNNTNNDEKNIKIDTPIENNNINEEAIAPEKEEAIKENKKSETNKKTESDKKTINENKSTESNKKTTTNNKTKTTNNTNKKPNNNTSTKPNTNNNSSNSNNTNNNTNNNNTNPPKPTYSCPGGYSLSGTQCISIINANYVCPNGTDEVNDTSCINLSDGYFVEEEDNCPNGYTPMKIITLGGPDKFKCIPLQSKIYTCPDGYSSYQTSKCIRTINATAH